MRNPRQIILRDRIMPILKSADVTEAAIFDSTLCQKSLNILIEFRGKKILFDLVDLKLALQSMLKQKVRIITFNSVNPLFRETIYKQSLILNSLFLIPHSFLCQNPLPSVSPTSWPACS